MAGLTLRRRQDHELGLLVDKKQLAFDYFVVLFDVISSVCQAAQSGEAGSTSTS
jgi:hypothetical protein